MDILSDLAYEQLLGLSSSGAVVYGAASPSCSQYSRIKMRGGGLPPLRTPDHLEGVRLSPTDLEKVQNSHIMVTRCIQCLILIFFAGGHCHLEQPASAMSWLEPAVQDFPQIISAFCINIPACSVGWNIHKTLLFASSSSGLVNLAQICENPPSAHEQVAGRVNSAGDFFSKNTATYPPLLAGRFATLVQPLISQQSAQIEWPNYESIRPVKVRGDLPPSQEDGGGIFSQPDWSKHHRPERHVFQSLRTAWNALILQHRLDKKLM